MHENSYYGFRSGTPSVSLSTYTPVWGLHYNNSNFFNSSSYYREKFRTTRGTTILQNNVSLSRWICIYGNQHIKQYSQTKKTFFFYRIFKCFAPSVLQWRFKFDNDYRSDSPRTRLQRSIKYGLPLICKIYYEN